jgi:hypothetical protein
LRNKLKIGSVVVDRSSFSPRKMEVGQFRVAALIRCDLVNFADYRLSRAITA